MAITVQESVESRKITWGTSPSVELRYIIRGTTSDIQARQALESTAPVSYDPYGFGMMLLPRESVSIEPIANDIWDGTAHYSPTAVTYESTFTFDTGGGTQHITQSRQTVGAYALPGKTPPNFGGAIGVTHDNVEGVDITVPVYSFTETHYLPETTVTPSYKATLFGLTGRVNSAAWNGFAAGEVLFLGASGSKRVPGPWEIAFRFAASPNVTGLVVGSITGINKKGWEYLWVRYADAEDADAKAIIKRPIAAYVERVYDEGDFSALGIGT